MNIDIDYISEILKKESLRITKSRLAVAEIFLSNKEAYLTPEAIFKKILKKKGMSCDQVSVYRILTKFEEIGLVRKSNFHNDASRYILDESLGEKKNHKHEHYFKCISCLSIEAFSDCFVSAKEKELKDNGYTKLDHHIEITGLCPRCSNQRGGNDA